MLDNAGCYVGQIKNRVDQLSLSKSRTVATFASSSLETWRTRWWWAGRCATSLTNLISGLGECCTSAVGLQSLRLDWTGIALSIQFIKDYNSEGFLGYLHTSAYKRDGLHCGKKVGRLLNAIPRLCFPDNLLGLVVM